MQKCKNVEKVDIQKDKLSGNAYAMYIVYIDVDVDANRFF